MVLVERNALIMHASCSFPLAIFLTNKYWQFLVLARFYKKKKKKKMKKKKKKKKKRKDYF